MFASRAGFYSVVLFWGVAVVGVWLWTADYGYSIYPASEQFDHREWPPGSTLTLAHGRPTLLLFIHPRCPCTSATIQELEELLTGRGLSARRQPRLIVVATIPSKASDAWRDARTVRRAAQLPSASVQWDVNGVEAARFGAVASGTVMLYAPDGARLFAGGVTASRGHEGGNVGVDRVWKALTENGRTPQQPTPVFGCRLCVADHPTASGSQGD